MTKTVMIVDDEADIRTTLKSVLESEGYKVVTAVDGDDCLKQLKNVKPDLILMDIMMPGTHVSKIVPQITDVKVAYLSIVRMSEAEKEGLLEANNIVDYIQKPFSVKELIDRVKKLIGD